LDNLNFDYHEVAGCTLPFLNYTKEALKMAFPNTDIRNKRIITYGSRTNVLGVYFEGCNTPAFYVDSRGSEWNAKENGYRRAFRASSLIIQHDSVTVFNKFKVGKTRFIDLIDAHIVEAQFMVDGTGFMCLGERDDAPYSARFLFNPPDGFNGDFVNAPGAVLEQAVLAEIMLYVCGREYVIDNNIGPAFTEDEANRQMAQLLETHSLRTTKVDSKRSESFQIESSESEKAKKEKALVALLFKDRLVVSEARKAYMALADISIHAADPVFVKEEITKIFKSNPDEDARWYLSEVANIKQNSIGNPFFLCLDHKAEIVNLNHMIEAAFNGEVGELGLPDPTEFPKYASISLPGVLDKYSKALISKGYDLNDPDDGSDTFTFCITPVKNRKRVRNLFAKAQIG